MATERARAAGATEVNAPVRVAQRGYFVSTPITGVAGHCQHIGIAWPASSRANVSLRFAANADGTTVNDSLAGRSATLAPPAGEVSFCADHDGTGTLTIAAIDAAGTIANVQLEYAVAVGTSVEDTAAAAARRQNERDQAANANAMLETNLQRADYRQGGEAFAAACARCRRYLSDCSDERKACWLRFETCAQALGTDARGRVQCAHP